MKHLLVSLAVLAASACATQSPLPDLALTPSATAPRFDDAIAAFEAADKQTPPRCATLFVGASSIRFWKSLKEDFPDRTVINRGFGGSTVWEVDHYFDRVVKPYHPKEIVFYAGENDLWIDKRTPDQIYADFVQFMRLKEKALGDTPVYFISAKVSKQRFEQLSLQADYNAKVKALAAQRDDLAYIDVVPAMLKPDGTPKDIYVADNLHMTPEGYAIWTPIVDAALDAGQSAKAPGC
ncbi:MAG: GDSL-type esterase/lipase family protein [Hyphomonadaceae bacterium]